MPTTPQLPPLPRSDLTIGAKLVPYEERSFSSADLATKLGYSHDQRHYFTASTLHARDRQIVELCASIADNTVIAEGSHAYNGGAGTMANSIVAAIRALLGDKGEK